MKHRPQDMCDACASNSFKNKLHERQLLARSGAAPSSNKFSGRNLNHSQHVLTDFSGKTWGKI
eukprot:6390429-Amphidinium_carterae.3